MRETLRDFCLRTGRTELLEQWDQERNPALTPDDVTYGSRIKIWWQCSKKHKWQAAVFSRTSGSGACPFCAGKRAYPGETDLATRYPELARQWHPRNGSLTPDAVLPGSHMLVWWQCEKGHEWQATIASRALDGAGCPVCAGKQIVPGENDLASRFPLVAAQMASGEKRPPDTGTGVSLQQSPCLVALSPGTCVADGGFRPNHAGQRLSLLQRKKGAGGIQ